MNHDLDIESLNYKILKTTKNVEREKRLSMDNSSFRRKSIHKPAKLIKKSDNFSNL